MLILGVLACLLSICYGEIQEIASRGAPNPASQLPRMRAGGKAPMRNQYRMSYHPEEEQMRQPAHHQPQPSRQHREDPRRQHQPAREGPTRRPAQQMNLERARRPQRQHEEAPPRRRKIRHEDDLGYEEIVEEPRRRPLRAVRRVRRPQMEEEEPLLMQRRAHKQRQADMIDGFDEYDDYDEEPRGRAIRREHVPRQRAEVDHRGPTRGRRIDREYPQLDEDPGRRRRRMPDDYYGQQREPEARDENEVMAEAIRLLQAQDGIGLGTQNNPFGLPVFDEESVHKEPVVVEAETPVRSRKRDRVPQEPRGKIREEVREESDSLQIPMPDWMVYAGRIGDDVSSNDHMFMAPDKITKPITASVPKIAGDDEMPIIVVKAEDDVVIQKGAFLQPIIL